MSNRQIAASFGVSEHCVRLRLLRMSRQALLFHRNKTKDLKIVEPVAYDGLENFSRSQYDMNNINQAIGADSLFQYDFNFAPLNRKGRMSSWQKQRLRDIELESGRYDPSSVRKASQSIFERLYKMRGANHLELLSDQHFQYKRALNSQPLKRANIIHKTVSSRECRNYQNILFNVNHADLLIRHRIGAFRRETICFSKTEARMIQKYILFFVEKNYMKPQFSKIQRSRPEASQKSPAQLVGVCDKILGFKDVFYQYPYLRMEEQLNDEWKCYWQDKIPDSQMRSLKFRRREK